MTAVGEPGVSVRAAVGNLPVQLTRLVGRDAALAELASLLSRARLVTLCGPGGAGKTRLALALAYTVRTEFPGGAWWVDLSTTLDPALVGQVVAAVVAPTGEPTRDPSPAAIAHCFSDAALLVLDNCEQVADGCAELATAVLGDNPELRVLGTSRRSLGVPGEQVWRTEGLEIETSGSGSRPPAAPDGGGEGGAVALFLERAREAVTSFDGQRPGLRDTVTSICRRLDGLPLAIELAAARVPVLGVQQIAQRLERDSSLLRQRRPGAPARQRTLQATLEWSYRLLDRDEQRLFARLGCFRGSFSLEAAEEICADDSLAANDVLDGLQALVDCSLVRVLERADPWRYELLLTVHQYAAEKLVASEQAAPIQQRHARFFSRLAQQHGVPDGEAQLRWLKSIEVEHDNLNQALRWLLGESISEAAELACGLWGFWRLRGYYRQARGWFEQVLAAGSQLPANVLVDVLIKAGEVVFLQCDYASAIEHLQRAHQIATQLGDPRMDATIRQRLGSIAREQARYGDARQLHHQSLDLWRQLDDSYGAARALNFLGFIAWLDNHPDQSEQPCQEALAEFRHAAQLQEAAETLVNLGAAACYRGDHELAQQRLEEALTLSRRIGFQEGIAWALHELAILARQGRRMTAEHSHMLREALLIHHRLGDRWRLASVLEEIAGGLLAREHPEHAVELFAAADALREHLTAPIPPAEAADRDHALDRLHTRLKSPVFASRWNDGRALSVDDAVDLAAQAIDRLDQPANPDAPPILTRRETAVLRLLSQGQTNREIGAALYISPSTAGVHVSNILLKLGCRRRVDAAAKAHKLGLTSRG